MLYEYCQIVSHMFTSQRGNQSNYVFPIFSLVLELNKEVEASHDMQKYDLKKIFAYIQQSNSDFLKFLVDNFLNRISHKLG